MTKPIRVQRKRTKGFRLESPNGLEIVYVGRPSKYGNPWSIGDGYYSEKECVTAYKSWLEGNFAPGYNQDGREWIMNHVHELRGKNLACCCPIDQACHADVLLELANDE